jgi:hypothetical protein
MSTDVNDARLFLLDEYLTKNLFTALRDYYQEKESTNLKPLLNVLEGMALNAITERQLFINLLYTALKSTHDLEAYDKERENANTELQDKIHRIDKDVKQLKEKDVGEIIKKYLQG